MIVMDATTPNSTKILFPVMVKAAKPVAVVALVSRLAVPIRVTIRDNAFTLLPCALNS